MTKVKTRSYNDELIDKIAEDINAALAVKTSTDPEKTAQQHVPLPQILAALESQLSWLGGIMCDWTPEVSETRRRIHLIAELFFCKGRNGHVPFSADSLVEITAYIDALPKTLGFDYVPVLQREAALLIPRTVERAYDVNELLPSFFTWKNNKHVLQNRLLIVGLFLMFFRTVLEMNSYRHFQYDIAADTILDAMSLYEIRPKLDDIIRKGL